MNAFEKLTHLVLDRFEPGTNDRFEVARVERRAE